MIVRVIVIVIVGMDEEFVNAATAGSTHLFDLHLFDPHFVAVG